jgi:hypothetical protein
LLSLPQCQALLRERLELNGLIPYEDALQFEPLSSPLCPQGIKLAAGGFKIPYFDINGDDTGFFRFRYLENPLAGLPEEKIRKVPKYSQPHSALPKLYLAPIVDWRDIGANPTLGLVVTEGEIKSAVCCAHGIPCIGLGGVWSFKSKKEHEELLPDFDAFQWKGRPVTIVFDSDASTNPMVEGAALSLARLLIKRGALVAIHHCPSLDTLHKTGLDDYIISDGIESFKNHLSASSITRDCEALHEMNTKVVLIANQGVIAQYSDMMRMKHTDFVAVHYADHTHMKYELNSKGELKEKEVSTAKEWLKWPHRAKVGRIAYAPGEDRITPANELNIWPGWGAQPIEGDSSPFISLCNWLFKSPDYTDELSWFMDWLAYPLQNPGSKMNSAVLLWSVQQGTGKSLLAYTMMEIYGDNAIEISMRELTSNFNPWQRSKQFIVADEIASGDKRLTGDKLKSLITQKNVIVNEKNLPEYLLEDRANYLFTSNHPDALFLEDTDRRFFVFNTNESKLTDEFYSSYDNWLKNENGASAVFHFLLCRDVSRFNPQGAALSTVFKQQMARIGKSDIALWVAELKEHPERILRRGKAVLPYTLATSEELLSMYDPELRKGVTSNGVSRALRSAGMQQAYRGQPIPTEDGYVRLWIIQPEEFARYGSLTGKQIGEIYDAEHASVRSKIGSMK